MKNGNSDFIAFEMPPIYTRRLLRLAAQDSNHGAADGPLFMATEYCLREPNSRGRRYPRPNPGVMPINTASELYAESAIRYPHGITFKPFELLTGSMLVGNNWDSSETGREYIAQLLADEKIVEVGRVVSRGEWVDFHLTAEGVDAVFGTVALAKSRLVRKADGAGVAPLVPCELFILTKDAYLPSCRPSTVPAGALVPECAVDQMPACAMPAGTVDAQGWPSLTGPAKDFYRALAVIESDCFARADDRGNPARMSPEQTDWLAAKLAACAVPVEVTA